MKKMVKSKVGKWSLGLMAVSQLLLLVGPILLRPPTSGELMSTGPHFDIVRLVVIGGSCCLVAAFVAAVISMGKFKEKSLLIVLTILVSLLEIIFVLGLIISGGPHPT